jgi:hypothetical protein
MNIINMTGTLTRRLCLFAAIAVASIGTASANLSLLDTIDIGSQSTDNIIAATTPLLGGSNLTNLLRLDEGELAPSGSFFTITYGVGNTTADVSWDLTGSGFNLLGIYVFGGNLGANLYQVTDLQQMISGMATINAPVAGNSGQFAGISHIVFLGTPTAIPEPSVAGLILTGLGALLGAQRFLRRRG